MRLIMNIVLEKFFAFVKKEIVFFVSFILAMVSCVFVNPSMEYFDYIDWNVLFLLFSFMAVVVGLRESGVFDLCGKFLCNCASNVRILCVVLVFLCFGFSMFITNDVALLTFVPFTIMILLKCNQQKNILFVVVLQTIAANLGSMLTPMGNPQNLFLFSVMDINVIDFCLILVPYTIVSGIVLYLLCFKISKDEIVMEQSQNGSSKCGISWKVFIYIGLFIFCILAVLKIVKPGILALVVAVVIAFIHFKLLLKVDYILILTFVCFFIFSGNIQNITVVKNFLQSVVSNNEFIFGFLSSQIISNVPATLLLYPFSSEAEELLLGVNVGGLGTIVASLASLIAYKLYASSKNANTGDFFKVFTLLNLLFIVVLFATKFILGMNYF